MLGIIIGMFAIILVTSVGAGAQSLIVDQIARRGTDQIAILAGASEEDGPPAQASQATNVHELLDGEHLWDHDLRDM